MSALTVFGLAAAFLTVCADAPKEDVKKELEKFEGEWALVSGVRDGKPIPEEEVKVTRRTSKGETFTLVRDSKTISKGTLRLDPSKKPKTIDIVREDNPDKPLLGIYELDGENYKICYAAPGKDRPTEFSSKEGSGWTLTVWKKAK